MHPLRECPLDNAKVCAICVDNHDTKKCPSLLGIQAIYRESNGIVEPSSQDAQKRMLAQGKTQGSTPRVHQHTLTIGPFSNTCEAYAVSPEVAIGGLQDIDVYNQREYQVDPIQEQYNIYISLTRSYLLHKTTYHI
jgi:hypothetical protein